MLHTFESKISTWRPTCEVMQGHKTTCRATASKQRPPGIEAQTVLEPNYNVRFKVPERSVMQRLLRPRGHDGRIHVVKTSQGDIPVVLSSKMKSGKEETYRFGPDPDFLIRAEPAPVERPMFFQLRTAGKVQTIKVVFPPGVREIPLVPDAMMVKVPDGARPGSVIVFKKHPADPLWLRTHVPQTLPANGFLAVALPSFRYESKPKDFELGDICKEICVELEETFDMLTSCWPFRAEPTAAAE